MFTLARLSNITNKTISNLVRNNEVVYRCCGIYSKNHDMLESMAIRAISTYGEPVIKSELNIQPNKQVTTADIDKYNAYKQAVSFYQASVNISADPCTDFYQYACGNYKEQASTALTKEKAFSDACIEAVLNNTVEHSILVNKNYLLPRVNQLAKLIGSNFTFVFGGNVTKLPDKEQFADALSYLSFTQGIDTFVTPFVDTNWEKPTNGYRMFLDQNTAFMSKTYYAPSAFKTIKEKYIKSATSILERFIQEQVRVVSSDFRK
ncbi:hypothetical protein DICVIV_01068 [Dictyocaulus viviparus]|uniref:Peptidase M13 N-terminal domain-containing protein n=1 Tax=Dictyocaulus viviparus TaxID=29172 RepID=A0A0D8Y9T5_DICVI|nr:hypothetical protein DICVIV_01068 [Dictyocaulus viviparus]